MSAADDAAMIADTYYDDPAGYVRDVIGPEPDAWQTETLADIARESRIAVASGHGIGKTALISWIIKWFLATRPDPQVVVTANTRSPHARG